MTRRDHSETLIPVGRIALGRAVLVYDTWTVQPEAHVTIPIRGPRGGIEPFIGTGDDLAAAVAAALQARFPSIVAPAHDDICYATTNRQEAVKAIKVGEPVAEPQDRMERVRLLSDIPEKERPKVRVIDPAGPWFKAEIARAKAAKGAEFSACDVNIPVEVK